MGRGRIGTGPIRTSSRLWRKDTDCLPPWYCAVVCGLLYGNLLRGSWLLNESSQLICSIVKT